MTDTARTPPHNAPAEEALISGCLTSPRMLDHALGIITPDDLYIPANRRVFAAMTRLHADGQPVDPVTVADEVRAGDGRVGINPANVTSYLCSLGTTAHSPRYATIVARDARLRRLLHLAEDLTAAAHAYDATAIDQALDALHKERQ